MLVPSQSPKPFLLLELAPNLQTYVLPATARNSVSLPIIHTLPKPKPLTEGTAVFHVARHLQGLLWLWPPHRVAPHLFDSVSRLFIWPPL
jgi:hypothetical protein